VRESCKSGIFCKTSLLRSFTFVLFVPHTRIARGCIYFFESIMAIGLQIAYTLGIVGVLGGAAILFFIVVRIFSLFFKWRKWQRVYWVTDSIISPFQYFISVSALSMCIMIGSSMNYWNLWLSFSLVSLMISFFWINFHRVEIYDDQEYFDATTPLNADVDEEYRMGSFTNSKVQSSLVQRTLKKLNPKRLTRNYLKSIREGFRKKKLLICVGIVFSFLLAAFFSILTADMCIAIRPVTTSTRFTRYFKSDSCPSGEICHVYFTLPEDPSTAMIVNFQSQDQPISSFVKYSILGSSQVQTIQANWFKMERLKEVNRYIYWAEVTGLVPGQAYSFIPGYYNSGNNQILSKPYKIRTVPSSGNVTFVAGGDMQNDEQGFRISEVAASYDPYFAFVGGDVAYANGNINCYRRWDYWFETWDKYMKTSEGFSIPFSLGIGNHEAGGEQMPSRADVAFYLDFFSSSLRTQRCKTSR